MPRHTPRQRKPSKRLAPSARGRLSRALVSLRRAWRREPGAKKQGGERSGIGFLLLKWCFIAGIWGTILMSAVLAYYAHDLPDVSTLNEIKKRPSVTLVTRDGTILANYGDLYGRFAQYRDLPPFLVKAVLATEDRRFYDHFGVDIFGLARAMVTNVRSGYVAQGGSTISQQLAKNVFLTSERSMKRKIQEMLLALWLERRFSKAQILAMYLNRVYLGGGAFGVDAAAERYFGKELKELNQKEMALLAGLLKAPSRFAPTNDPELAEKRATQVLLNMVDAEYITEAQAKKAMKQKFGTEGTRVQVSHSIMYFSDWIMDVLTGYVGQIQQDLRVKVTLDAKLQTKAEEALAKLLDAEGEKQKASQGALVAMHPDGAVVAMVGGRAYTKSQFNRATQAQRQPGSSFKYFVYLAALEAGANPEMMFEDKPIQMKGWSPENYNRRHEGEMTMRQAFATSNNSIAVQISEQVGRDNVIAMAQRLGIHSPMLSTPSVALGTNEVNLLELTGAYAHVANNGESVFPYGIEEIRVAQDDGKGEVLYRRIDGSGAPVLAQGVVTQMADLMQSVVEFGTGGNARIGRPVAGKTGTSQDYHDGWFLGFTPQLVTGVWLGNDDSSPMKKVTGGGLPARVWHDFMIKAMAGLPVRDIPRSGGSMANALPWAEHGNGSAVIDTSSEAVGEEPPPQFEEPLAEHESGKTLWDKVFGHKPGVEYTYPEHP